MTLKKQHSPKTHDEVVAVSPLTTDTWNTPEQELPPATQHTATGAGKDLPNLDLLRSVAVISVLVAHISGAIHQDHYGLFYGAFGVCNEYKPWLRTTDISSRGTSVQWCSSRSERANHAISQGEYRYLLLLKYSPPVLDIREQFPLEVSETQAIARALGVRHPLIRGKIMVMTTDFLVTVKVGSRTFASGCWR